MRLANWGVAVGVSAILGACSESQPTTSGVSSVNGLGGAVTVVSSDASVRVSADTTARTLDVRAIESDPLFAASPASGIRADDVLGWTTALGWGDHSVQGYLKTEANTGLDCVACVSVDELAFDGATQAELDGLAARVPTSVDGLGGGTIAGVVAVTGTLEAVSIRQNGQVVCDTSGNCGFQVPVPAARYGADPPQAFLAAIGGTVVRWRAPTGGATFESEPFLTGGTRLQPTMSGLYRITARISLVRTSGALGASVRLSHSVYGIVDIDGTAAAAESTPELGTLIQFGPGEFVEVIVVPDAGSDHSIGALSHLTIQGVGPLR